MTIPVLPAIRGYQLRWDTNLLMWVAAEQAAGGPGGATAWGDITGTLANQTDLQAALDAKAASAHTHAEADVTNLVSDLALKAPLASPTFTGTVAGVTATMVGLGSVDNTSDASKPVSTAQQTALNLKADSLGVDDNYVTDAEKVKLGNLSGTNTGDQTVPVKATGAEINTGTDDAKFATAKAITDSNVAFLADIPAAVTDATIVTTDITTNDATTAKHGWLQKLPGGTTNFLRADGSFAAPTATAADPSYSPGTLTIATETARLFINHAKWTTTQRLTIAGTGRASVRN